MEDKKAHSVAVPEKAVENNIGHLAQYAFRNLDMDSNGLNSDALPMPVRRMVIYPANLVEGVRFCNTLVHIETTNVVHFHFKTGVMQYVSQQDMNEYIDRNDPRVSIPGVIPNLSDTNLCIQVCSSMKVDGRKFREEYPDFVPGLAESILEAIENGTLDVCVVPFSYAKEPQYSNTYFHGLHRFVKDMREKTVSANVSGRYEPNLDRSRMFHGLTGKSDKSSAEIEGAFFGQLPPQGSGQRGWIIFMYIGTIQLAYSSLLNAHCDGTMESFFNRSGLLFPDIAFRHEDEAARRRDRQPKTRKRGGSENRQAEQQATDRSEMDGNSESGGEKPPLQATVTFGSFADVDLRPQQDDEDADASPAIP